MGLENPLHLAIVALVILMVFGAKRLPEIGRSVGSGLREFKASVSLDGTTPKPAATPTPAPTPAVTAAAPTPAAPDTPGVASPPPPADPRSA